MSTTMHALTALHDRLTQERDALVERMATVTGGVLDQADLGRIAHLHNAVLAVEAVRKAHMPKVGSGSEV